MKISVTERGVYKRCRRQWDLTSNNRKNLMPMGSPKPALQLGSLVHKALADWTLSPNESLTNLFIVHAAQEQQRVVTTYRSIVGADPSPDELESLHEALSLGMAMMTNYQNHWGAPLPQHYNFVSPEQRVEVPVPNTPHILSGTFDALVQDDRGYLYIVERKTYTQTPNQHTLDHNDQFLAYIWLLTRLAIGPVGGVLYDGMRKVARPPRAKTLADIFMRCKLRRPTAELDEFERDLPFELNEMGSSPHISHHRRWEGCWDCDMDRLCSAMSKGDDVPSITRRYYTQRPTPNGDANNNESTTTEAAE